MKDVVQTSKPSRPGPGRPQGRRVFKQRYLGGELGIMHVSPHVQTKNLEDSEAGNASEF